MDYYEDTALPGLYRYAVNRYPYVEVEHGGELFHAQAHGWKGDKVMVAKPAGQLQRIDSCGSQILWIPAESCRRIRSEDSTWITTEDDHYWHENQDQMIDYRPRVQRD